MQRGAVIYARVSSQEQTKNLSLATQEAKCREYCDRHGIDVDRVFIERGESATSGKVARTSATAADRQPDLPRSAWNG